MISKIYEADGFRDLQKVGIDIDSLKEPSCATNSQIAYLMGVIKHHKFKNGDRVKRVLEVGVCTGLSSLYMLKAGKEIEDFCLYGIEKGQGEFYGHIAYENADEIELKNWKFFTGHTTYDVEKLLNGEKLDVVFIDGMHSHPGPLIDFLMLYPYMRDDAIVIFHDVEFYTEPSELGACYFYTGWTGTKRLNYYVASTGEVNMDMPEYMGILCVDRIKEEIYNDLIQIAKQPITGSRFNYGTGEDSLGMSYEEIDVALRNFMLKKYEIGFVQTFVDILLKNFNDYKEKWIYYKHQNRLMRVKSTDNVSLPIKYFARQIDSLVSVRFAVWGAGFEGKRFVSEVLETPLLDSLVLWCDRRSKGAVIQHPECLKVAKYDILVIATVEKHTFMDIKQDALKLGIPEDKIKWLHEL